MMALQNTYIDLGSNIKEIHELGMGHFGKVVLAETGVLYCHYSNTTYD